jgi:hypothetical protein
MQVQNRFVAETALFESLLPDLMKTDANKWFVAWDGEMRAIVETLQDACQILSTQPDELDVLVREISMEEFHLPLYFAVAV